MSCGTNDVNALEAVSGNFQNEVLYRHTLTTLTTATNDASEW